LNIRFHTVDLHLKHPFTIARGSSTIRQTVILELEHDGIVGFGEAAPLQRYDESISTVSSFFEKIDHRKFADPFSLESILLYADALSPQNNSAKAAIDIALHDWMGKRLNVSLWKWWGIDKRKAPLTSFTIGIDVPSVIEQKILEAKNFPVLKVKLGGHNDEEIVETIRKLTDKPLRVDANEGWKVKELARDKIRWLASQNVEFVEQPMPANQSADDLLWLHKHSLLPLIADESVKTSSDIPLLKNMFDGINIKLMKSKGTREALRMIHTARALGMSVMIGCMIESSVGISAALHLSPLVDYADLDGNLLITNDPFEGLEICEGSMILNDRPGLGVFPK